MVCYKYLQEPTRNTAAKKQLYSFIPLSFTYFKSSLDVNIDTWSSKVIQLYFTVLLKYKN